MAGQADWLAFGLPTEGRDAGKPRARDVAVHRGVPTCALTDRVSDIRSKVKVSGWDSCLVIDDRGIVFGRIQSDNLRGAPDTAAEEIMAPGPTTVRQSEYLDVLVERMKKRDVADIIVTNSVGELIGVLRRDEAERYLEEHGTP